MEIIKREWNSLVEAFKGWSKFEYSFYIVLLLISLGIQTWAYRVGVPMPGFEQSDFIIANTLMLFGVFFGLTYAFMLSKRTHWAFFFGIFSGIIWTILNFWYFGAYLQGILFLVFYFCGNIYYLYNFYSKPKIEAEDTSIQIKNTTKKQNWIIFFGMIIVIAILTVSFYWIPEAQFSTSGYQKLIYTFLDATIFSLCALATYFAYKGYKQNWNLFILANIVGITYWGLAMMSFGQGSADFLISLLPTFLLWFSYGTISIYGLAKWNKEIAIEQGIKSEPKSKTNKTKAKTAKTSVMSENKKSSNSKPKVKTTKKVPTTNKTSSNKTKEQTAKN